MDRFAALLLQSHPKAEPVLAPWFAFSHEVSLAPRKVTEPAIGQIRLKWWTEAAEECLDATREARVHPAVTGWNAALDEAGHRPAPGLVLAMIEAHALDLEKTPYADIEALRADATARWGNQLRVGLQLLHVGDENHHHAANHVGAAFGMMQQLYAATGEDARGRQVLPGLGTELDKAPPEARAEAGLALCGQALYHLDRAQELLPKPQATALPVLRFGLAAKALIDEAEKAGGDPAALPDKDKVADTFALRLTWARLRGRYV